MNEFDNLFQTKYKTQQYMRRRSGALHCDTQEQLLQLASNTEMGLYYNQGPLFKEIKFQKQWNINEAQNNLQYEYQNFQFNQQHQQANQQQKQLKRGTRYLENCIVEKQTIRCTIQICLITQKLDQTLSKMLNQDSLLRLFTHNQQIQQNCIYKHSKISSFPNSNVFCLETTNFECFQQQHQKQNIRMTPKNWLKQGRKDKAMQLVIVKKNICIKQDTEIDTRSITIIYRIFVINANFLQNPIIKIYLKKSHYVVDTRSKALQHQYDSENQLYNHFNKQLLEPSLFDRKCKIFNRGWFESQNQIESETSKFKFVFHKIEEKIAKTHIRKLNDILAQIKQRSPKKPLKTRK